MEFSIPRHPRCPPLSRPLGLISVIQSVLKRVVNTMTDSFDLFYGIYKYNTNYVDTIQKMKIALDCVIENLKEMKQSDKWVAVLINVLWPQKRKQQQLLLSEDVLQVMNRISATYLTNSCFVASQKWIISVRQFIQNMVCKKYKYMNLLCKWGKKRWLTYQSFGLL